MQKYVHLVELEKCCQTHIFLQNFDLIQPRTSPPKIFKICKNFANYKVAEAFVTSMLPQRAEQLHDAGVELIWLTTDFFLTLAARDLSLRLVVRFWDLTFLHGPAAMFSGLLALLDLCLPRTAGDTCPELSCKVRSVRDRTIRTFQIGVRSELLE